MLYYFINRYKLNNVFYKRVDHTSELTTSKTHQKVENSYFNILTTT